MPSSLPINHSPQSIIPPTPESDFSTSPQSPPTTDQNHNSAEGDIPPITPQRRKAGRKPLYKTAQERRDRNRRAQLAFRARRSDYLSKLEDTCRSLEAVVMELQQSNRAANDALARERTQVKLLQGILQNQRPNTQSTTATNMFSSNSIAIPTDNNNQAPAGQAVSSQLFPQVHSLITMEQQFAQPSTPQTPNLNNMVFTENYTLGMLPLPLFVLRVLVCSCRSVIGISPPTYK